MMVERRKYRFRTWDKKERAIYPVISVGRGMVIISDELSERTRRLEDITLMQFTGLRDVNNQDIYEGDLLEIDLDGSHRRKMVMLQDGSFRLIAVGEVGGPRVLTHQVITRSNAQVVGNTYNIPV